MKGNDINAKHRNKMITEQVDALRANNLKTPLRQNVECDTVSSKRFSYN